MAKEQIDIAVIIPLEEELEQFQEVFSSTEELSAAPYVERVDSGRADVSMVAILQEGMGKTHAAAAASYLNDNFEIGLLVSIGICGGLSSDLALGDVCYSSRIIDVLDNTKVSDNGSGWQISLAPEQYETPKHIVASIDLLRRRRLLKQEYQKWRNDALDRLGEQIDGVRPEGPIAKSGSIACGAVSASEDYNQKLKAVDRKLLAIDTESGGVFERAKRFGCNALTIRAVSDFANSDKSRLEEDSKGVVREYAARNACEFLKTIIEHSPDFQVSKGQLSLPHLDNGKSENGEHSLHSFILELSEQIQARLADLSPEYKLLPKGYILPTPRIRKPVQTTQKEQDISDPLEVRDALKSSRNIFISVSQSYPEKSLAWVIADDLLRSDLQGRQILPAVANGKQIRPPNGSIEAALGTTMRPQLEEEEICDVVIIDGMPLTSRSRMKHLIQQIEMHPKTHFVFVDRTPSNLVFENEFAEALNCEIFELCDVSFSQMAHFVQTNFDMSPAEADVIALRLRNTFKRFQLAAHPSYFAGIPQNTISSLIQANQRAELMELAVVGFLSFVVADDKAGVQLSRSARERFLRDLIVELRVEKRSFDHAELIALTQDYAKEYGFDISPIDFIKGFTDHNILNFQSGRVAFSLPFMEHYLLARALFDDPNRATTYFDIEASDFDIRTFDLYCEIGPSSEVVADVVSKSRLSLIDLSRDSSEPPVIWSAVVDESVGSGRNKAASLEKQIKAATTAIHSGTEDRQEKQVLLDAADRVNERVTQRRGELRDQEVDDDQLDDLAIAASRWSAAVLLLGSGAEHLNASRKEALVSAVLEGVDLLLEHLVRLHMSIDYEEIKADLSEEAVVEELLSGAPDDFSRDELIEMLLSMVDGLRFLNLSTPFHTVVSYLCEHARQPVLALPVRSTQGANELQEIIRLIWAMDIEPQKSKNELKNAIKNLPPAILFRIAMATHFVRRVYWTHAQRSDRLLMLDAAEETLKSTSFSVGKGELTRLVERKSPEKPEE